MDALSRRWLCVLAAILTTLASREAFVPVASRLGTLDSPLGPRGEKGGINPGPSEQWMHSTPCLQMLCVTTSVLMCAGLVARHLQVSPKRAAASSIQKATTKLRAASGDSIPAGRSIQLFSPAKVNLFLRIIRRRPDGYHDLASLFHTVSFGDKLDLEVLPTSATKDELECNLPGVPVDDSNLVIRALKLFRSKSGIDRFFKLRLQKQIPAQAGMGGGSSNAASAFFGASLLCGSPATEQDLLQWGDDPIIGSDATFFLSEGAAYCTGRGEIVTPVTPLPIQADKSIYLVKPKYGLSTPSVFKALKLDNLSPVSPEELLQNFQEKGTSHSKWVNDLEPPAFQVAPNLGELKQYLSSSDFGFEAVLMSGSGSTIYCVGDPLGGADAFKAATKEHFEIEGIWRTTLIRRKPGEWYSEAA